MKRTAYLETTVVSYLTAKPSRDLIVATHQQITRDWWGTRSEQFTRHPNAGHLHTGGTDGGDMMRDPIVEEVRVIRRMIEDACGHDPRKFAERLNRFEEKYASRLVKRTPKPALPIPKVAEDGAQYRTRNESGEV